MFSQKYSQQQIDLLEVQHVNEELFSYLMEHMNSLKGLEAHPQKIGRLLCKLDSRYSGGLRGIQLYG